MTHFMADLTEHFTARDMLLEDIRKEMLGPGSENSLPDMEHEIITDQPEVRYSVGILFPQEIKQKLDNDEVVESRVENEENISEEIPVDPPTEEQPIQSTKRRYGQNSAEDSDTNSIDEEINLSTQNMPSSMGMTFFVHGELSSLHFGVSFGTYRRSTYTDCCYRYDGSQSAEAIEKGPIGAYVFLQDGFIKLKLKISKRDIWRLKEAEKLEDVEMKNALYKLADQCGKRGFVREPHSFPLEVPFADGDFDESNKILEKLGKLTVLKRNYGNGIYAITVILVNTETGAYNGMNSIFQPEIRFDSTVNPGLTFEQYNTSNLAQEDIEEKSLALLYRDKRIYASGHGVATNWNVDQAGNGEIWTEVLPAGIVPQMDFDLADSNITKRCFSMKYLSDLDESPKFEKLEIIKKFIDEYGAWIADISIKSSEIDERFRETAIRHISNCKELLLRMYYGIELLQSDETAYIAFQLVNRSMLMQRIHTDIQKKDSYPGDKELQERLATLDYYNEIDEYFWRPFQLAFILISMCSIVEPNSTERDWVDLIWFPTGGGKTEAYLGLTAFTIFYRRLMYPDTYMGTTVIMRYTLRLLAAQQFIRAGTLICACEAIRLGSKKQKPSYPLYSLGTEPITIGLWIGSKHTPNRNDEAKIFLSKLHKAETDDLKYTKDISNRFQMLKCPWCGTKLVRDVEISHQSRRLVGDWGYFMRGNKHFFLACTQEGCRFKEILPIQVVDEELYDKPPTLLFGTVDKFAMVAWKSRVGRFFAADSENRAPELIIQDELHLISGPLGTVVGIYETAIDALCSAKGVRPKIIASTATIRSAKAQCRNLFDRDVRQFPPSGIDAGDSFFAREADVNKKPGRMYLGIMSSGKTKAMMEVRMIATLLQRVYKLDFLDSVKDKFWTLAVYFNSIRDLGKCSSMVDDDVKDFMIRMGNRIASRHRLIGSADELTSRVSSTQLNETLDKLERLEYSQENQENKTYPINVLLASNMISVGVDVARLNLMLIVGQPKLTSEYIQASSRIGRSYPGLACVLYDGAKSRDRSHYEQFKPYHESFYRFVEPTSVTPFSKPARERALHAVLVSLLRHRYGLTRDTDAQYFPLSQEILEEIEEIIINRVESIRNSSDFALASESNEILSEIRTFWKDWKDKVNGLDGENFLYGEKNMMKGPVEGSKRLLKPYGSIGSDGEHETLTSMRNVDNVAAARIVVWGDEE